MNDAQAAELLHTAHVIATQLAIVCGFLGAILAVSIVRKP